MLYDPASGMWSSTGSLSTTREYRVATLLANGKVLVAGGYALFEDLSSAELYDQGLGFDPDWQPLLTIVSLSILPSGSALTASGSRFQGISKASGDNGVQNYPPIIRWFTCRPGALARTAFLRTCKIREIVLIPRPAASF